jgi:hypothetical protein
MTTLARGMPIQYAYLGSRNSICPLPTPGLSFTNMPTLGLVVRLCGDPGPYVCLYAHPGLGVPIFPPGAWYAVCIACKLYATLGLGMPICPPWAWICIYSRPEPSMHCQYSTLGLGMPIWLPRA